MYIELVDLKSWKEFVDFSDNCKNDKYIFRGQSNSIGPTGNFIKWRLESSFNRFYTKRHSFSFDHFLNQHLNSVLFDNFYGKYKFDGVSNLKDIDALQKSVFLQHYGVPTCLVDFTFNPLIALYFSMSGIQGTSSGQYDDMGNSIFFSPKTDRDFVSIFRLNWVILRDYFGAREISKDTFVNHDNLKLRYYLSERASVNLGLFMSAQKDIPKESNYNLHAQMGCFLYFDNVNGVDVDDRRNPNVDLIRFFELHEKYFKLDLPEPVVTVYNIDYNSFMNPKDRFTNDGAQNESAFTYLKRNGIFGETLFNDIQGLKYDFNYFHSR